MSGEKKAMFSKKTGSIVLIVLSFLAGLINCKGPYTAETHPVI